MAMAKWSCRPGANDLHDGTLVRRERLRSPSTATAEVNGKAEVREGDTLTIRVRL